MNGPQTLPVAALILGLPLALAAQSVDVSTYVDSYTRMSATMGTAAVSAEDASIMNDVYGDAFSKPSVYHDDATKAESSRLRGRYSASSSPYRLTFQRDPSISSQVREAIIRDLIANDPSLDHVELEAGFKRDQILSTFDKLLATFGYSGANIVDALTAFYIVSWEIVNNADASHNIQGIRATHDKLLHAALNNPKLTSLSNDEKQKFAETLAYQVVLTGAAKNELIREGDTARLQQLRGQVRTAAMKLGPDPYTLKLTDQGLVPKS
jgi:hypothetical protein